MRAYRCFRGVRSRKPPTPTPIMIPVARGSRPRFTPRVERRPTSRIPSGMVSLGPPPPGTYPRYSKETLAQLDERGEISFGADGQATPARKSYLTNVKQGVVPVTIWPYGEVG